MDYVENKYKEYMGEANAYAHSFDLDPPTKIDGEWDAFRHAYASAAATQDYGGLVAHIAGEANELYADWSRNQPKAEREMDEWNNAVGRRIGNQFDTRDEIAWHTRQALDRGDLITSTHGGDSREYSYFPSETPTASHDLGTQDSSEGGETYYDTLQSDWGYDDYDYGYGTYEDYWGYDTPESDWGYEDHADGLVYNTLESDWRDSGPESTDDAGYGWHRTTLEQHRGAEYSQVQDFSSRSDDGWNNDDPGYSEDYWF